MVLQIIYHVGPITVVDAYISYLPRPQDDIMLPSRILYLLSNKRIYIWIGSKGFLLREVSGRRATCSNKTSLK